MIKRAASHQLVRLSKQFKALALIGPRQSGKTTLVRSVFANKPYVSLENPDTRLFATEDPRGFLAQYAEGAILDEAQRTPQLFSYLQQLIDENDKPGQFIITGSNNFLLQESIHQTLAGRVAYINLLPLTLSEIGNKIPSSTNEMLTKGFYPSLYASEIDSNIWHENYIKTYVERDVRLIKNITDLYAFERFLRLAAGRTGQLLNLSSLGVEVGVDAKTMGSWISVLESSFIAFRLPPYFQNFSKRIAKMPKLYFYDTGLLCTLLGVTQHAQLETHPLRGAIFENFVVAELLKQRYNNAKSFNLFFWRSHKGHEVDVVLSKGQNIIPIEIKSGATLQPSMLSGLAYFMDLAAQDQGYLIYTGNILQQRSSGIQVLPYQNLSGLNSE